MKRIAVIGAGTSGLVAIKSLLEEGLEPVCFELTTNVGGLWNYTDEECPDRGTVFEGIISNASKDFLAYSDFPQHKDNPTFASHTLIAQYFDSYAEKFDLKKYIRFEHKIIQVKPTTDHNDSGDWTIKVLDLKQQREYEDIFDGVMVCVGHHTFPKFPNFPGREFFKGQQLHSHDYRKPDCFAGQNVLVVGLGNSGCDVAAECAFKAKQVTLSTRRGGWIVPRTISGVVTIDTLYRRCHAILHALLPKSFFQNKLEKICNRYFDHKHLGIKPNHRVTEQYVVINDIFPLQLINGKARMATGVTSLTKNGAVLMNGQELSNIDTIIYATGFKREVPFLKGVVDLQNELDTIYKFVFPALLTKNNLAFIGLVDSDTAIINVSEIQSRWVARVFAGKVKLPNKADMIKDAKNVIRKNMERFTKNHCVDLYITSVSYVDQIAAFIGVKPNLWSMFFTDPKLFWACLNGPVLPYQFRLRGPHSWPQARETILRYNEGMGYHLKASK